MGTMFDKLLSALAAPFRGLKSFTATKSMLVEELFGGWLGRVEVSKLVDYESYLRAGSKNIWAVWKCCDRVAAAVMETEISLIKTGPDGAGKPTKVPELDKLLAVPNPFFNFSEMVYLTVFHLKLTGNAYWIKDEPNVMGDRPKKLWVANPKSMKIVLDPNKGISGYLYNANGVDIPFDPQEIIHFRKPHPNNEFYGLGEIEAGEPLFQDFLNRQGYVSKFWMRGASPSGVMSTKEQISTQSDLDKVKARFESQYGGKENSGKTMFLTGDWTYTKLGLTMEELQHVDAWKMSIENICQMMGVPLSTFGIRDAANYATAEVSEVSFKGDTVKPMVKLISDTLNSDLVAGYGPNLSLLWKIQGLINSSKIRENYGPMFDRGILSINEMREQLGLAKIEGDPIFDQHFILATLVPLELAGLSAPASVAAVDGATRSIIDRQLQKLLGPIEDGQKQMVSSMAASLKALAELRDQPHISIAAPPATPAPNVNVEFVMPSDKKNGKRKVVMQRQADGTTIGTLEETA